ncbi:MAG: hypothetical protein COY39_01575 [Alphaproteobacteria bacterium CG_4_10_14_0_8_um_filter_37_21]|nr:MAG: hypothetical protein COY39_01575 [Alphaproteobacteria bacterium CG_4_10_14_0_8_um_filter_37_21]
MKLNKILLATVSMATLCCIQASEAARPTIHSIEGIQQGVEKLMKERDIALASSEAHQKDALSSINAVGCVVRVLQEERTSNAARFEALEAKHASAMEVAVKKHADSLSVINFGTTEEQAAIEKRLEAVQQKSTVMEDIAAMLASVEINMPDTDQPVAQDGKKAARGKR